MRYTAQFKNIKEEQYTITLQTGSSTNPYSGTLVCGDPACIIKSSSNGLYTPIKSRSCEITLLVKDYIFDLYSKTPKNTKVWVYDKNSTCIFFGYLTPCIYSQNYTYLDSLELEAIDAVSVLKDINFDNENKNLQLNLKDLVCSLLKEAGYTGNLYVPDTYDMIDTSSVSNALSQLYISGGNFFGDDEQHLPMTCYDILTEIMKFMGWSLCPDGMNVWLIDYRSASQGSVTYKAYSITTGNAVSGTTSKNDTIAISKSNLAGGTPKISMDDVYNKITVSDNLYEIDELAPDVSSDSFHSSVTEAIQAMTGVDALNISQWTKTRRKNFLWWHWDGDTIEGSGTDYQTFCTFTPDSGFTHQFWHIYDPTTQYPNSNDGTSWAGLDWYDQDTAAQNSYYKGNAINTYMNTVGCLMQHHALVPTNDAGILPTSISWEQYLTFFILNDTATSAQNMTAAQLRAYEKPVLTYHIDEQINYKPRTGTNWIVIKGDLWYQSGGTYKSTSNNKTYRLDLVIPPSSGTRNGQYVTCPIDKPSDVPDTLYYEPFNCLRRPTTGGSTTPGYGEGWPMWKMQLRIGNKYWNGSSWVENSPSTTFNINYNNSPDIGTEDEYLECYSWMKTCSNTTFKDKVGEEGYCIPITKDDSGSFVGDLELTIYTPSILPIGVNYGTSAWLNWNDIPNMVYVKDFDINYIYTDDQVWYKQHSKSYKDDYIYTAYIDEDINNKFSGLNLKMNTALAESPISRSFVCKSTGYLSTLRHDTYSGSGQVQEKNLLDQYLDHYKEPKPIYEVNLHGIVHPWYKYTYSHLSDYIFLLDSYSLDLKYDNARLKIIAF